MCAENPYRSPDDSSPSLRPGGKWLAWSVATVFGSALLGAMVGLGIGAALGAWVPGYYRSVFFHGNSPQFDPLAVGIGQGLTQGLAGGAAVGVLLVALFYWFRSRLARNDRPPTDGR